MKIVIQLKIALKAYTGACCIVPLNDRDKMRFCLVIYHIKVYQNENCCRPETLVLEKQVFLRPYRNAIDNGVIIKFKTLKLKSRTNSYLILANIKTINNPTLMYSYRILHQVHRKYET